MIVWLVAKILHKTQEIKAIKETLKVNLEEDVEGFESQESKEILDGMVGKKKNFLNDQ